MFSSETSAAEGAVNSVTGGRTALTVLSDTYWLEFKLALGKIIKKAKFYLWNPLVFNLLIHSFRVYLLRIYYILDTSPSKKFLPWWGLPSFFSQFFSFPSLSLSPCSSFPRNTKYSYSFFSFLHCNISHSLVITFLGASGEKKTHLKILL